MQICGDISCYQAALSLLQVILAQLKALEAAERVQDARRGLEEAEEEFLGMVAESVENPVVVVGVGLLVGWLVDCFVCFVCFV